jgi:hypothetical protein
MCRESKDCTDWWLIPAYLLLEGVQVAFFVLKGGSDSSASGMSSMEADFGSKNTGGASKGGKIIRNLLLYYQMCGT